MTRSAAPKHLTSFFAGMKLAQITTARIRCTIRKQRTDRGADRELTVPSSMMTDGFGHGSYPGGATLNLRTRRSTAAETAMLRRMFPLATEDDKIVQPAKNPAAGRRSTGPRGSSRRRLHRRPDDQLGPQFRASSLRVRHRLARSNSEVLDPLLAPGRLRGGRGAPGRRHHKVRRAPRLPVYERPPSDPRPAENLDRNVARPGLLLPRGQEGGEADPL